MQAPAGGRVVGKDDAPFVQTIWAILKGEPEEVTLTSERFACPRLETVTDCVPVSPPKPRLPTE